MSNQNLTEKKDDNFVFVSTLFWMNKERQLRNDIDCHVSIQAPNLEERKHFGEEYSLSCPSYLQELCLTLTPIELLSLVSRCESCQGPSVRFVDQHLFSFLLWSGLEGVTFFAVIYFSVFLLKDCMSNQELSYQKCQTDRYIERYRFSVSIWRAISFGLIGKGNFIRTEMSATPHFK